MTTGPDRLLLACGNPSRGDDALGPLFLERMSERFGGSFEGLTDFQLQVEHALDLQGRELALFVDAGVSGPAPYSLTKLTPHRDDSYTTHALSPDALLAVFEQLELGPAPPCFLLSIRGYSFELGEPLSLEADGNLRAALDRISGLIQQPLEAWGNG